MSSLSGSISGLDSLVWQGVPDNIILSADSDVPVWPEVSVYTNTNERVTVIPTAEYFATPCGNKLQRKWTAYNTTGASAATKTQSILFLKKTDGLFTPPNDTIIQCGEGIPNPPYQTVSPCNDLKIRLNERVEALSACTYSLIRSWHLEDPSTFSNEFTQHIRVVDTIPPSIVVRNPLYSLFPDGGELVMFGNEPPQFYQSDVEIHDNCCDPDLAINCELINEDISGVMGPFRRWKVSFVATDLSQNSTSFSLNIIQYDERNKH
jgi:hypothetical protein